MRKTLTKIALTATLVLAITFTLSCTTNGGGGGSFHQSDGDVLSSSSYGGSSSTSGGSCLTGASGTFTDSRDGKSYKWVKIGEQTWMAENLNYDIPDNDTTDVCYNKDPANCAKYGRLYKWATAMALPNCVGNTLCREQIDAKHRGICPSGWHIPSYNVPTYDNDEWKVLIKYIQNCKGCSNCGAKYLKSASGWNDYEGESGNGTDEFGFSALPSGSKENSSYGSFYGVGKEGYWFTTGENSNGNGSQEAFSSAMYNYSDSRSSYAGNKGRLHSIRCIRD